MSTPGQLPSHWLTEPPDGGFLRVDAVRKRFGPVQALDGATFAVGRGELFGLLGPNGAGKTTLMSIIAGLLPANSGEVHVGADRIGPTNRSVRLRIGIAPQDLAIYPDLSAEENLEFFGRIYGLNGELLRQRVDEALAAVQLSERRASPAGTFSGGMKRRLNLAVAVVHQPELLLLDEPTTGVDPQSRSHMFDEVRRLNSLGTTVIYSSHYMEEVQTLCRRVAILDHGRVVCCDRVDVLLDSEESVIRFRAEAPDTIERLRDLAGIDHVERHGDRLSLRTRSPQTLLSLLVRRLSELGEPATDLEILRPSLERVFLRLTGHALRD